MGRVEANSVSCRCAIGSIQVKSLWSEMIDKILQHQHPLRSDVVEGDSQVAAAVHSQLLIVLDVLNIHSYSVREGSEKPQSYYLPVPGPETIPFPMSHLASRM